MRHLAVTSSYRGQTRNSRFTRVRTITGFRLENAFCGLSPLLYQVLQYVWIYRVLTSRANSAPNSK